MLPSHRCRFAGLALVVWGALGAGLPAPAAAQPLQGVTLQWNAPPSCRPSAAVLGETRRLLGPDFRHAGQLEVTLAIEPRTGGFFLRLEVDGETARGARELELPTCAELRDTAGLLIALLLDPDLELPEPKPAPAAEPPAPDPPEEPEVPEGPPDPRDALRPMIGLPLVGIDSGLLPGPTLELGGWVGLSLWRLRFELGLIYMLPRSAEVDGASPYQVPMSALAARPRSCLALLRGDGLELGPCVALLIGRVSASPDAPGASSGSALLLAPELGAAAMVELNPLLSLEFSAAARIPLRAPSFVVETGARTIDVRELPAASAQAEISLIFRP